MSLTRYQPQGLAYFMRRRIQAESSVWSSHCNRMLEGFTPQSLISKSDRRAENQLRGPYSNRRDEKANTTPPIMFVHRKDHMLMYPINSQNIRDVEITLRKHLLSNLHCHTQSAHVAGTGSHCVLIYLLMNVEEATMKRTYTATIACP